MMNLGLVNQEDIIASMNDILCHKTNHIITLKECMHVEAYHDIL